MFLVFMVTTDQYSFFTCVVIDWSREQLTDWDFYQHSILLHLWHLSSHTVRIQTDYQQIFKVCFYGFFLIALMIRYLKVRFKSILLRIQDQCHLYYLGQVSCGQSRFLNKYGLFGYFVLLKLATMRSEALISSSLMIQIKDWCFFFMDLKNG